MVIRTRSRAPAEVVFLIESLPEPLIVTGLDYRIVAASRACPRRAALRSRQSERVVHHTPHGTEHIKVQISPIQDRRGRVALERALARHGENWKALGISERMLYRKLRAHGFNGPGNGSRSRGTEPTP